MSNPTEEITVTMTREELEELAANQLKECSVMLNECRQMLKENPGNASRRIEFISRELDRLNDRYIHVLVTPVDLEVV